MFRKWKTFQGQTLHATRIFHRISKSLLQSISHHFVIQTKKMNLFAIFFTFSCVLWIFTAAFKYYLRETCRQTNICHWSFWSNRVKIKQLFRMWLQSLKQACQLTKKGVTTFLITSHQIHTSSLSCCLRQRKIEKLILLTWAFSIFL